MTELEEKAIRARMKKKLEEEEKKEKEEEKINIKIDFNSDLDEDFFNEAPKFDALIENLTFYSAQIEYNGEYDDNKKAQEIVDKIKDIVYFGKCPKQNKIQYLEELLKETEDFLFKK